VPETQSADNAPARRAEIRTEIDALVREHFDLMPPLPDDPGPDADEPEPPAPKHRFFSI